MKPLPISNGSKVYAVEDDEYQNPILVEAEVGEVLSKQFRLVEGDKLFGVVRFSKSDPRVSPAKNRAIESYISRKKRQIRDLTEKKKMRTEQLQRAKLLYKIGE